MTPDQALPWIALAVSVLSPVIVYVVSSARWSGNTTADIRHIEAMLEERRRDILRLEEHIKRQDVARHDLRRELTTQQGMYWSEVSKRLEGIDRTIGKRLDAIERMIHDHFREHRP